MLKINFKLPRYSIFWEKHFEYLTQEEAIKSLMDLGYKEIPTCNGGDDDRIIIDNDKKQWAYFEYGFTPFGTLPENFPTDRNLTYHYRHSH